MSQNSPEAATVSEIVPGAAGGDDPPSSGSKWSPKEVLTGLTAPVSALVVAVGGLAATGVLGRVERNQAGLFQASLILVTVGGALLLLCSSLRRHCPEPGREHLLARLWGSVHRGGPAGGTIIAAIGIALGVGAAVSTASQTERPMITLNVDPTSLDVTANVRVSNVPSDRRMVLVIDGLQPSDDRETYEPTTVYQAYVGPDGDGKIDLPVKLRLQSHFSAVGVKAYVSEPHKDTGNAGQVCTPYPRRVSTSAEVRGDVGPGCVIVALPDA